MKRRLAVDDGRAMLGRQLTRRLAVVHGHHEHIVVQVAADRARRGQLGRPFVCLLLTLVSLLLLVLLLIIFVTAVLLSVRGRARRATIVVAQVAGPAAAAAAVRRRPARVRIRAGRLPAAATATMEQQLFVLFSLTRRQWCGSRIVLLVQTFVNTNMLHPAARGRAAPCLGGDRSGARYVRRRFAIELGQGGQAAASHLAARLRQLGAAACRT